MKHIAAIVQFLNEHQPTSIELCDRPAYNTLSVAKLLSRTLPLPTSAVDNPRVWYRNTLSLNLLQTLSDINEVYVLDLDETESLTYKLWEMRYQLVHGVNSPTVELLLNTLIKQGTVEVPESYVRMANQHDHLDASPALFATIKANAQL